MAIVHEYLNQRSGGERVVLELTKSGPARPIFTLAYDEGATFPEFVSRASSSSRANSSANPRIAATGSSGVAAP